MTHAPYPPPPDPEPPATKEAEVEAYLGDELLPFLGLYEWKVKVIPGEPGEECVASISTPRGVPTAKVKLSAEFWALDQDDQTGTLLHEALHLTSVSEQYLVSDFAEAMGPAGTAFERAWDLAQEYRIDRLAAALVHVAPAFAPGDTTSE